jgi:site-specific DNA-methyltransferase (cytosine-N4-specific)
MNKKELPINQVICGDTLETLKTFPAESIDCVITSPPYYGLRDYGIEGQIGLEKTPEEYLDKLREIMIEIKRVLKKTGTVWWNMGDTYSSTTSHQDWAGHENWRWGSKPEDKFNVKKQPGYPSKCLLMIPERFAFNMIKDGWILRNKIIWHKPNAMPSSVKDRFSNCWEYLFLFSKSKKYYFDLDAVREKHKWINEKGKRIGSDTIGQGSKLIKHDLAVGRKFGSYSDPLHTKSLNPLGKNPGDVIRGDKGGKIEVSGDWLEEVCPQCRRKYRRHFGVQSGKTVFIPCSELGSNPGDFWSITTQPFKEAHFAVFPEKLCERPILAGCPKSGIVLDPFCGSGTALVVAKRLGRNFIGIDIKLEYCEMARKRLEKVPVRIDRIIKEAVK